MLPHDLTHEWLALSSPGAGDLRLLGRHGVTHEAVHRAGGLAVARISTAGRLWMPDGAQVCDKPDHACLIAYGNGRRMEAVRALGDTGIKPPRGWEL